MKQGMVYLVGAGPGDYKLISVKALEYIQQADTIVYDRLADDRLLSTARPDVELIYVGKASSNHTMRQEDINQLLVDKAKEGKNVVRLKGGDPFVFGRGGEEALTLVENKVSFEVVPGITSAISVPAYAGIPVTHRGIATSFAVITGHEDPTKAESTIKWSHLATAVDTLVFLMGVENLPHITTKLIENGRSADTPAAVIRWGTKPEQRVLVTTVGKAAADVAREGIKPPAIFIVGEVVNLRQDLAWFDQRLLFGKTALVTRAREQASALTCQLENLGAQCIEAPSIKLVPPESYAELDKAIDKLATYNWMIFTSVNGVEHFFTHLYSKKRDSRALGNVKIAAIGAQTAASLKNYGILADIVPLEFRAEGIVAALNGRIEPGMSVLIPRALVARDILPEKLREMGATVDVVPVYRTLTGDSDGEMLAQKLSAGEIDLVTFTSSSTVTNLLELLGSKGSELLKTAKIACIGPITAGTCLENGIKPDVIAEEYTIHGMVEAITTLYKEAK
ncbi:uroporphyrinogen-III C-methyltransferase [Pelosinus sp. UFO1]|uniref:uroporphyrinogen-III C-methyltransferase n=1 Tax=Pelosinus sp. UFO1 TaxID=484770 RepID=UPI0004D0E089|nr:uroporphyrinogen-III C-methyltransferase [Pelosinus sp. UFO1]AIF49579.1 uroporphyrin-III C-methyltransferase [Pelosinus sp. UFO1]